jgi:hypothetical protein
MPIELSYGEVSTVCRALLLKAEEAERDAQECAKLGDMDNDVKFWQNRAKTYREVYEKVEAQRSQLLIDYERALAALEEKT